VGQRENKGAVTKERARTGGEVGRAGGGGRGGSADGGGDEG